MRLTDKQLAKMALSAARRSHSPYSGIKVGAALDADGEVFLGANVENCSYGLTICAERAAVAAAISAGARQFRRIAVASNRREPIRPCGACLQVLSEFSSDLKIILAGVGGEIKRTRLRSLYPRPFLLRK